MAGPFKMKEFSGFGNSPVKNGKYSEKWLKQIFSANTRYTEAEKRQKKQKDSGEMEKYQQSKVSKTYKGSIPIETA